MFERCSPGTRERGSLHETRMRIAVVFFICDVLKETVHERGSYLKVGEVDVNSPPRVSLENHDQTSTYT